jgi:hypothetical protein
MKTGGPPRYQDILRRDGDWMVYVEGREEGHVSFAQSQCRSSKVRVSLCVFELELCEMFVYRPVFA